VCLSPPVTWDATEAARKALSCVYRTGQRFGAGHVIDVLRGQSNERSARLGHDRISTFGIGAELSAARWRSIFRQLVIRGYLRVDHGGFGALKLTESSRPLLRGEQTLALREQPDVPKSRARKARSSSGVPALDADGERHLDVLKALRRRIADEAGVPPYVVFHDATLTEMVARRPGSPDALLEISGVGRAKLEKYGARFLEAIADFAQDA
jgi:ATP-dependent DNA helicase RecQ